MKKQILLLVLIILQSCNKNKNFLELHAPLLIDSVSVSEIYFEKK